MTGNTSFTQDNTPRNPNSVFKNSIYGLLGFALPTLAMLATYPVLIKTLGAESFGIFVLATSLTGLLSLMDLGFTPATVKFVAEDVQSGNYEGLAEVILASALFFGILGAVGTLLVNLLTPRLVEIFRVAPNLRSEAVAVFRISAYQMPPLLLITVCIAVFKGLARFKLSTVVLTLLNTLSLGSVAIAVGIFHLSLRSSIAISVFIHFVILIFAVWLVSLALREQRIGWVWKWPPLAVFRRMLRFSSLLAIVTLVGVTTQQLPKFLIGMKLGPAEAGMYAAIAGIAFKVHSLAGGATEVMMPYSAYVTNHDLFKKTCRKMQMFSVGFGATALFPLIIFPFPLIALWLGRETAGKTQILMRLLALATMMTVPATVPYHVLNGVGKPVWNALIGVGHLCILLASLGLIFLGWGLSLESFGVAFLIANSFYLTGYLVAQRKILNV